MVRILVRETLEREGYKVMESADPVEARRDRGPSQGRHSVADHRRGYAQAQRPRAGRPAVGGAPEMKVLYMSGYTDNAVLNSGILHQDVAFLQKPFTPSALTEKVREVLEKTAARCRTAGEMPLS